MVCFEQRLLNSVGILGVDVVFSRSDHKIFNSVVYVSIQEDIFFTLAKCNKTSSTFYYSQRRGQTRVVGPFVARPMGFVQVWPASGLLQSFNDTYSILFLISFSRLQAGPFHK